MADKSPIEWTDATWNPIRGCSRVSEGCRHCYAEGVAARFSGPGLPYEGLARRVALPGGGSEARWTNEVAFAGDKVLLAPLHWRQPRRIFVNSMSDLFHENVPDEIIDRVFAVMALCPQHTFQILTKRPERMRSYFAETWQVAAKPAERFMDLEIPAQPARVEDRWHQVNLAIDGLTLGNKLFDQNRFWTSEGALIHGITWPHGPLANVWLGVSVEDQATAEARIPDLLQTPAAVRFLSCEPLLGPINLSEVIHDPLIFNAITGMDQLIHWVIVGGESGRGARPMHPAWARSLRDQCATAGVQFFFKQWGEWHHRPDLAHFKESIALDWQRVPSQIEEIRPALMVKSGKKVTGRLLDDVTHDAFPEAHHV